MAIEGANLSGVNSVADQTIPPANFDAEFQSALINFTDSVDLTEVASAQLVASGNNPHPLTPDAWVYGVGTGSAVPQPWKGGAFILSPTGNPLDFTTADGTPGNTIFTAKPLTVGRLNPATAFGHGLVGTWNPATNKWEPGYGGSVIINAGGVPIMVWLNARVGDIDLSNYSGTLSANFGAAVSVDQAASRTLAGIAAVSVAIPGGQGVAAGSAKAAAFLAATGQGANLFVGAGYRVELKFTNGQLDGIYYKGQEIVDLDAFAQNVALGTPQRYKPPVIPNQGHPEIANFNYTNQLIFGTSPWDLAATSNGLNHGNGAVAVANAWRSVIQTYGQAYYDKLPSEIQSIVVLGPRSMSDAGSAVNAILNVADSQTDQRIISQLQNPYNLDFGVFGVKLANEIDLGLAPTNRPQDYQFVRNAFQGNYRYYLDNPQQQPSGGGFRF